MPDPSLTDLVRERYETGAYGSARLEVHPAGWATLRERMPPTKPSPLWGLDHAMSGLLGIPVVETEEVPTGRWRLVDRGGTVLHEGAIDDDLTGRVD